MMIQCIVMVSIAIVIVERHLLSSQQKSLKKDEWHNVQNSYMKFVLLVQETAAAY